MRRNMHKKLGLVAAFAVCASVLAPKPAHAEEVAPDAKGIVGGALLGGEIVVFTEAIFGVRSTAAYLLGAAGGAIAGGVGGYFVEQAVDDAKIPAGMLAGGLALVIPAVVVVLDQTRYMPTEGAREDKPVQQLPAPNPGQPGGGAVIGAEPKPASPESPPSPAPPTAPNPTTPTTPPPGGGTTPGTQAPTSLFDVHGGAFRVGVPVPEVRPILGANERRTMGVENRGSELRFPVVRIAF